MLSGNLASAMFKAICLLPLLARQALSSGAEPTPFLQCALGQAMHVHDLGGLLTLPASATWNAVRERSSTACKRSAGASKRSKCFPRGSSRRPAVVPLLRRRCQERPGTGLRQLKASKTSCPSLLPSALHAGLRGLDFSLG